MSAIICITVAGAFAFALAVGVMRPVYRYQDGQCGESV